MTTMSTTPQNKSGAPRQKVAVRPNPRLVGNYEGSTRTIEAVRKRIEGQTGTETRG